MLFSADRLVFRCAAARRHLVSARQIVRSVGQYSLIGKPLEHSAFPHWYW